jgi:hypothetical protein
MPEKLSALETSSRLKILIYGHSGVRKTCFACEFPGPIYVADFDGKISSARNWLADRPEKLEAITYDSFVEGQNPLIKTAFGRYYKQLLELEKFAAAPEPFPYATVVLDSITTYTQAMLHEVMSQHPGAKRYDKWTPALQDYGIATSHFKIYLLRLLSLPCNVIVTAHIQLTKDEKTGALVYEPLIYGKLPGLLPIWFEEVYRAYVEDSKEGRKYLMQTQASRKYRARSQIKGLPDPCPTSYEELSKHLK